MTFLAWLKSLFSEEETPDPAAVLQSKFRALGVLTGMSKSEIIKAVGPPNGISGLPEGKTLLQWIATGYLIGLIFKDEICEGVANEFSQ